VGSKTLLQQNPPVLNGRGVESEWEFPGVRVLARSRSLSFEGHSDFGYVCLLLEYVSSGH